MIMDQGARSKSKRETLDSILIKPAGPDCNLSCDYCFYLKKADLFPESRVHRMSEDVLEETCRQMMTLASPSLSFGWQGGEPTLMGLDFFERAVEHQKRFGQGKTVSNGLQTNGLLLDEKWARFLRRYRFLVGLSLDGPEHVHDRYRQSRTGKGSWQRTVEKAKLLLDNGVMVNALAVVNDYSARFPEEIYSFLKALGFDYQQLIPCVEPAPETGAAPAGFSVTPEAYGEFLVRMLDCWTADFKDDEPTTSIRFFDAVLQKYLGDPPADCTLLDTCGVYLVVEHNGDVFPCDFFVTPKRKLGNVLDDSLEELFASKAMRDFAGVKRALPKECRTCPWLDKCAGGCPKDRPVINGQLAPSYFCRAYKRFFKHAHPRLQALASRLRTRRAAAQKGDVIDSLRRGALKVGRNDPCPCGSGKKLKKCCGPAV
jgi:uncharacterized protein